MPHTSCDDIAMIGVDSSSGQTRVRPEMGGSRIRTTRRYCERTTDVVGMQLGLYLIDLITWIL